MKKLIALFAMLVFTFSLSMSEAVVVKKMNKTTKKIVKQVTKKVVKQTQKESPKTPAIIVIPLPPPPPSVDAKAIVICPKPRQQGILGLGINTNTKASYIYENSDSSAFGIQEQIVFNDPLSTGKYIGLLQNSVKYGIGIGVVFGKDINNNDIKAIPVYADVIVNLPANLTMGLDSYVSGGMNYTVYGTDRVSGNYGVQACLGISHDYGVGLGKTSIELGWSATRCGSTNLRSAKGVTLTLSQPIML